MNSVSSLLKSIAFIYSFLLGTIQSANIKHQMYCCVLYSMQVLLDNAMKYHGCNFGSEYGGWTIQGC